MTKINFGTRLILLSLLASAVFASALKSSQKKSSPEDQTSASQGPSASGMNDMLDHAEHSAMQMAETTAAPSQQDEPANGQQSGSDAPQNDPNQQTQEGGNN